MKNFKENIDRLVSKILNEEIENRVKQISETKGQWIEIDMDEELTGKQSKIDVAKPKGKITAADFKKLRDMKTHKKEVEELSNTDIEDVEELSKDEPTYVGSGLEDNKVKNKINQIMFGSFDDEHGWFDNNDVEYSGDFDFDYEEEEFGDFPSFIEKHSKGQRWFNPNQGDVMFNKYQQKFGGKPFRVRTLKVMDEAETEEGNAFTGALNKAKKSGKDSFEVDGKKYKVEESNNKWIQKTNMKKGGLHKSLGIPEGEKIPKSKLNKIKKELMSKSEGDKKLSAADAKLLKQVNMALTLGDIKESKKTLRLTENELLDMIENMVKENMVSNKSKEKNKTLSLTENELIDMIENLVKEQIVADKSEKNNFSVNKPQGLKKTEKVLSSSKKENDDHTKEVVKKMKDYMKNMTTGGKGYDANPDDFPQSNYDMEKDHKEMKYHPSDAVEEYIEAFAYPGMTNLVYDEIKPDDEMITKQIKGDSKNGNAITGKDGKALGNVSKRSTKVGDRFKKNLDDNLYGAEQMEVSYNRQPQPVDVAGSKKQAGSLKSIKSTSKGKAEKIMSQLESVESKATKIINEDLQKIKNLISYNRKTQ